MRQMASSDSQPQLGGYIGDRAVNKRFAFFAALQEAFRFEVRKIVLCGLVRRAMRVLMPDHGVLRGWMLERVLEQCDLAMIEIAAHADLSTQRFGADFLRADGFVQGSDRCHDDLQLVQNEIVQIIAIRLRMQEGRVVFFGRFENFVRDR